MIKETFTRKPSSSTTTNNKKRHERKAQGYKEEKTSASFPLMWIKTHWGRNQISTHTHERKTMKRSGSCSILYNVSTFSSILAARLLEYLEVRLYGWGDRLRRPSESVLSTIHTTSVVSPSRPFVHKTQHVTERLHLWDP